MSIKRTITASIVGITLVASMLPAVVGAVTVEELLAQIAQLQAQLAQLQSQQGGSGVPAACVGVTFTRYLTVGSTGADVKCLQALLNKMGYTVAATGAGSPGNETTYFGPLTLAAVKRYQAAQGWTPANQAGPMTIAALNQYLSSLATTGTTGGTTGTTTTTPGAEGSFQATIYGSPASNANVTSTTDVPIYGIQFKAIGSDIRIERVDLEISTTNSTGATIYHPATVVKAISAYDGSTLLTKKTLSSSDFIKDSSGYYYTRISGINFTIPKDTTKVLTFKADFYEGLENDRVLTVNVYGSTGIRGVDGAGKDSWSSLSTTRKHTIKYSSVGSSSLTVSLNVNSPKETTVVVDEDDGAEDVPVLMFDARSTVGQSKITDVVVTVSGTGTSNVSVVKLYDGSTLLGSATPSSGTATFSDLEVYVPKNTTKTLTVKYDITANPTNKTRVAAVLGSNAVTYEKPDLSTAYASGTASGYAMYLFDDEAAVFAISSYGTASYSYNETTPSASTLTGVITFTVRAEGGTMTKPTASDFDVRICTSAGVCTNTADSVAVSVSPNTNIPDGNTATVTVTASETRGDTALGLVYFKINSINWTVGSTSVTNQTWGLDDFRTVYVNAY